MDKMILEHNGTRQSFVLLHAQNILNLQVREHIADKDCWKIPGDSEWEFETGILKLKNGTNRGTGKVKRTKT
jgi:hypothetical protein